MSSPQETYITYLAVKAGWDKAHIARLARLDFFELELNLAFSFSRTMLFHLIKMNPKRDITLHVSANNSAMVMITLFHHVEDPNY